MCGCSGGAVGLYGGSSTACNSKVSRLSAARNKLAVLFNVVNDEELKNKYKEDRLIIDEILKQSAITRTCPSLETVILIETEVENEYSKYYNT